MDKQTYTQRVQALAEEMAIDHFEKHIAPSDRPENGWDGLTNEQKKTWVEAEVSRARIAVAEMAAMFERGFKIGKFNYIDETWEQLPPDEIEPFRGLMKANGLIPDNEPDILPMQPGEPGYGGYNPDNPEPDNVKQLLIRLLYNVQDALDEYAYARNNPDIPGNGKTKLLAEVERRLNKCRKIVENNLNAQEGGTHGTI